MKSIKLNYFFLGLLLFYVISFFSPNKIIYVSSYFIAAVFFYLHYKDFGISLIYSLILALFSELGINGNLLLFGLYILLLLPFSLKKEKVKLCSSDILIFIFFIFNFILLFFNPYTDVLIGIFLLGEIICLYYLLRIHLLPSHLKVISFLILSMLFFQMFLGNLQLFLGRNIGLVGEVATVTNPFGNTTVEEDNLLRVTASYGHANMYAIVLLVTMPFLFISNNFFFYLLCLLFLIQMIFTYTRSAWLIGFPLFLFLFLKSKTIFLGNHLVKELPMKIISLSFLGLLLCPFLIARIDTIPQALESYGSFGIRIKLAQEASNLIHLSPLIGIGWNRFQEVANEMPVTDIFPRTVFSATSKIHNLYLEIATEVGIPGLTIFLLFLFTVFRYYFKMRTSQNNLVGNIKKLAIYSLSSLLLISAFHPLYLVNQFRLIFLLAAMILA